MEDRVVGGVSSEGRAELARVLRDSGRLVTVGAAARSLGMGRTDAAKRLARWAGEGWLRRVRRGLYIPVPVDAEHPDRWSEDPLVLADAVWSPCYFTGWTAANHWGLTEQVFRTTVLKTASRVRRSEERLLEHEYLLVHLDEEHFWGLATAWRQERRLQMADPPRTVIDVLDDPRLGGGIRHVSEVLAAYLDEHSGEVLVEYGDRLGNRTVFKRLGYLLERLGLGSPDLTDACRARLSSGISMLDPSASRKGPRVAEWGLRVNVHVGERDTT